MMGWDEIERQIRSHRPISGGDMAGLDARNRSLRNAIFNKDRKSVV